MTRHTRLTRKTPIRRRSKKRAGQERIYTTLRQRFIGANPVCMRCDTKRATDIHHRAGRTGQKLNDTTEWLALCRTCHTWIHEHPGQARAAGLLK